MHWDTMTDKERLDFLQGTTEATLILHGERAETRQ